MPEVVEKFHFKCLKAPVSADELPKLPPRALQVLLRALHARGLGPDARINVRDMQTLDMFADLMVELVALSLRRLNPNVTASTVADLEDYDEVVAAFRAIVDRNPGIFPKNAGPTTPAGAPADPLTPAISLTAPSGT